MEETKSLNEMELLRNEPQSFESSDTYVTYMCNIEEASGRVQKRGALAYHLNYKRTGVFVVVSRRMSVPARVIWPNKHQTETRKGLKSYPSQALPRRLGPKVARPARLLGC